MATQGNESGQIAEAPPLDVYYMRLLMNHADARFGKMHEGQIVAMPEDMASRYLTAGVAEQASESDYRETQDRRQQRASARQEAFRAINDGHAMWDVSTYRDVLTAPEAGLRQAFERGIPLVNVHMLRDEEGDPIPPDADIEDILDARELLHADLVSPLDAHDRSSVMGGGSPFTSNVPVREDGPMPLSPRYRQMAERVNAEERFAQIPTARFQGDRGPAPTGRTGRAAIRQRTLQGSQDASSGESPRQAPPPPTPPAGQPMTAPDAAPTPPPPPPADGEAARRAGTVAPDAEARGKAAGAEKPAKPASGEQIGN